MNVFDFDSRGSLSPNQFEQGITSLGISIEQDDLAVLNKAFDDSGDGEIDHAEFVRRLECLSSY